MRSLIRGATIVSIATAIGCSANYPATVVGQDTLTNPPPIDTNGSSIVSNMTNYYEENLDLTIDPCRDTFIYDMESIGYTLAADTVLPEGGKIFQYWFASCNFKSDTFAVLAESATAPIMAENETLAPSNSAYGWSRFADIQGRRTIIRPPAIGYNDCMASMTTAFGSITLTGGPRHISGRSDPCVRLEELLRQIEPWIND